MVVISDILVQGARPLFFMDYLASSRLQPAVMAAVVRGVAAACRAAGCVLLGGETAEMPGVYALGDYDLAGFVVGTVDAGPRRPAVRAGRGTVGAGVHGGTCPAHQPGDAASRRRDRAATRPVPVAAGIMIAGEPGPFPGRRSLVAGA